MEFTLYTSNTIGEPRNNIYSNKKIIQSSEDMAEAIKMDHVCATYRDNHRSKQDFIRSNVVVMDCDNDHSDDQNNWITYHNIEEFFNTVSFVFVPSRHNMKVKDGKSARPRFHLYFPIPDREDEAEYSALKNRIAAIFPYFDTNALDSGRFIFGSDQGKIEWHVGEETVDSFVDRSNTGLSTKSDRNLIKAGTRNSTLHRFATRVLTRYGLSKKALDPFTTEAQRCDPPLDDRELDSIWKSAANFYKTKIETQEQYIPPEEYSPPASAGYLMPAEYCDLDEAKIFVQEYGNELKYTPATKFLRFDGRVWVEMSKLAEGALEEFMDLQMTDASDLEKKAYKDCIDHNVDPENRGAMANLSPEQQSCLRRYERAQIYKKFVLGRRNTSAMKNTLEAAIPMVLMDIKDFDQYCYLLNTPDSTIDLRQGVMSARPHAPDDYLTKITLVSPGDRGKDVWIEALNTFFCGDDELIEYVQKIVGIAAIGKVNLESMIIAYGDGGNGKSTFWNAISRILGTYCGRISADALTVGCRRNVKPEMAELKGKRLVIASELEEGTRLNTAFMKQICSTDEIQAEKKYKDPFSFIPTHLVVLYTNHLPKVGANDDGTWRRLIVIPFLAKIQKTKDIKNYTDYLIENAGPYILSWIIEGAQKAIKDDFKPSQPEIVIQAIKAYRENNDWLSIFIEDCCETGEKLEQASGEFYQTYRNYCLQNGEYTRSTTDFYAALENAGYIRVKNSKGKFIKGLRLKTDDDDYLL
ncbi:MAG: primase C-terminal domain-containing protein [Anaerolineaceae bacterium]|nr:primase C-terminal domain-containing protein [Anaerolineaceae bacterium]